MGLLTLRMAWRNLWRNPRRTLITGIAIAVGLGAMVFLVGWSEGLSRHMIATVTRAGLGDAQIHAEGYRADREPTRTIPDGAHLLARAEMTPGVTGAAPRLYGDALVAIGDRSATVSAIGIDPDREETVTFWNRQVVAGRFLPGGGETGGVMVGRDLARTLEVESGSKLVLTLADVVTGDLHYYLVRVEGVLFTNNPLLDKRAILLPITQVRDGLGLPGGSHEIALKLDAAPTDRAAMDRILAPLKAPGIEVIPWQVAVPVIEQMSSLQGIYMAITLLIIYFLIAFGVVNTMSMSLMERFREFGILRALGTSPGKLALLILLEAACLGAVGSLLGLALGLGAHAWLAHTGISFGNMEVMGVGFSSPIRPVLKPLWIGAVTLTFLLLTPLVAAIVARRAAMVDPARALGHE